MRFINKACLFLAIALFSQAAVGGSVFASPPVQGKGDVSETVSVVQLVKMSKERLAARDVPGALSQARKAVAQDPAYADAWKQLGRILMLQGTYGEAASSLEMAQGLKPDDAEIRKWLLRVQVVAAVKAGRFREAEKRLEAILKTSPNDEEARELLALTLRAEAEGRQGSDLAELLTRIVALEPDRGGAWRDLGWTFFTKGQYSEAVEAWNKALQDKRVDRKALVEKAMAGLAEQKQTALAKQCWQRWSPGSPFLPLAMRFIEMNRLMAAREILTIAWDSGEDPVVTGLYLAYTESRAGACLETYKHLLPYSDKAATDKNNAQVRTYVATLRTCSYEPTMLPLVMKLQEVAKTNPDLRNQITDVYEKAANELRAVRDYGRAYDLLEIVLIHDANRINAWQAVWELARNVGREEEAKALLADALKRSSSTAVREGIEGFFAENRGDLPSAVDHYTKSLAAAPDQPDLRFFLFNDLIALGRYKEAQVQSDWFIAQVASGKTTVKTYMANSLSSLGKTEEALAVWQELYLTMPDNPYYAIETARSMFLLCRADEATAILNKLIEETPNVKAYELLAEIESALGNTRKAFDATTAGLKLGTSGGLLRMRADAADVIGEPAEARKAAETALKADPGNVGMNLILGRALADLKLNKEAINHYENLVESNSAFLPGLTQLRNLYSSEKVPDKALRYADRMVEQRPWDLTAGQLRSISQVEDDQFPPALKYLREQSAEDVGRATPVLIYNNIIACPYKGRTNVTQITSHLERLSTENYRFILPQDLGSAEGGRKVIVFVSDAGPSAMEQLDATLRKVGGRAVYVPPRVMGEGSPGQLSRTQLSAMVSSGRWIVASTVSAEKSVRTGRSGAMGSALTHRVHSASMVEDREALKARLDRELRSGFESVNGSKIFVYPKGDYGQLSLDTDSGVLETLRSAVGDRYQYAIAADDKGFVTSGFDPLRVSGRVVPPEWNADELARHLTQDNPLVRARLELAKALYMHSQYERANVMFAKAECLGANPEEVNFQWGSNAYIEGDVPTSVEKLRLAHKLNPGSERNKTSLDRSEKKLNPLVDAWQRGWSDNDNRSYSVWGIRADTHVTDRLQLSAFADTNKWSRSGLGSEKGNRFGAGARWYFKEEYWLDAALWHMDVIGINQYLGGFASVRIPNARWGGYLNLEAGRNEVDTVEAVRARIMANNYVIRTYSRIRDTWDLYADLTYTHYTDNNDSYMLDGIFMKRLHEWPFLGVGYRFRFGWSSENPEEYWSPQSLQMHEAYLAVRGEYGRFRYTASGEAGEAHDATAGWRFVWGTRLDLAYLITPDFSLYGMYAHRETPTYTRDVWSAGIRYRF